MGKISLVLACLACIGCGCGVQCARSEVQSRLSIKRLLLALTPRAAFQPGSTPGNLHPRILDRRTRLGRPANAMMSDESMPAGQETVEPEPPTSTEASPAESHSSAGAGEVDSNLFGATLTGESEPDTFRRIAYRRRTARDYDETKDVPDEVMKDILATSQRAPTGYNMQPYKVVIVRDKKKREELSQAFVGDGNIRRVKKAPVTVIFLADLEPARLIPRIVDLSRKQGLPDDFLMSLSVNVFALTAPGRFGPPTPLNLATTAISPFAALPVFNDVEAWSFKNTMLVASQMMLAAASHGVSSSPMEGFDTRRVFQVLKVPFTDWPRYAVPLAISMGYDTDDTTGSPSLRLPPEEIYFKDDFGTTYEGITSL
mmetsp:Transcript_75650/g.131063  ORF Transcript_75650/g.131063 Transcript_75650/m.131063 type:complete len:371 (-) Transcript_75650:40-1152(-)